MSGAAAPSARAMRGVMPLTDAPAAPATTALAAARPSTETR
ncbi:hypothetical protein [Nonomuraea sp. JJY05]